MDKLRELASALFFAGASRLIVAFTARGGTVMCAVAAEAEAEGTPATPYTVPYVLSTAQRGPDGTWYWPGEEKSAVPVRVALQDALHVAMALRWPTWAAGAGAKGTMVVDAAAGTIALDATPARRPRRRRRRRAGRRTARRR